MATQYAFLLAGGRSRRFGRDKTALSLNGTPLIRRMTDQLRDSGFAPMIVGPDVPHLRACACPIIPDAVRYQGPLAAIAHGLAVSGVSRALVAAADMPVLRPAVLQLLWRARRHYTLVQLAPSMLPLVVDVQARPTMEAALAEGVASLWEWRTRLAPTQRCEISETILREHDPHASALQNINTPEEWEAFQALNFRR